MILVLASQSPRRCEILKNAGYEFRVVPADIDEVIDKNLTPAKLVCSLSQQKAKAVFESLDNKEDTVVLGSDTIVYFMNNVLGKPKNKEDAFKMLSELSDNVHEVYTGVSIISKEKQVSFYDCTKVEFLKLSEDQIKGYIATGEPMDKAGAYGIQGKGSTLVKGINGDFFSVMGLPISKTAKELKKFGINMPY